MTIAEAENFYNQDIKEYEITKNKEFLKWYKNLIINGYNCYLEIEELQGLIDNIVKWYELKYPEREMEFDEGVRYFDFENIESMSKIMDMKQLMYRLPHSQLSLIESNYHSNGCGIHNIYDEKGKVIGYKPVLFMRIYEKDAELSTISQYNKTPYFLLHADTKDGNVKIDYNLIDYVGINNINLDELLILFKDKYKDKLDFKKLEECIQNHNYDIELRKRVLQLVALKLLYSENTIPERGYKRARRFINEFNENFGFELSTKKIDEIMNRDYTNEENLGSIRKTNLYDNKEGNPYLTVEKENNKIKKLIRKIIK